MARNSDIEFGKLALVLGFTNKENVYAGIRETALLQELGIQKRLSHIMYERNYLTPVQIQSILWALYRRRQIQRFPARVVYEFTAQDDSEFLGKVAMPLDQTLATWKSSGEFRKALPEQTQEKKPFPQDVLIYCMELQKQLKQKGFPRTLLSILNAKGYLQDEYRDLVPDIRQKKKILSSPIQAKSPLLRRLWETVLFSAWAVHKNKLTEEQVEIARKIWGQLLEQFKLPLKFSEVMGYLGYMGKGDLTKLGVFVAEFANLDQIPRFHMFDLTEEERSFIHSHLRQQAKYQKVYRNCLGFAEQIREIGLTIPPEELLIHKQYITRAGLQEARQKIDKTTGAFELMSTAEYKMAQDLSLRFAGKKHISFSKRQQKELATKMIPFSLESLEKEFESQYLEEKKAARERRPEQDIQNIIEELSHTQLMAFQEIAFSPTEDSPLKGSQIRAHWKPPKTAQDMTAKEHTEYISLDSEQETPPDGAAALPPQSQEMEQTGYIAIDASASEIKQLSHDIVKNLETQRFSATMLISLFIVAAGVAIIESRFKEIFGSHIPAKTLALYTGGSMFMVFIPSLFIGDWLGRQSDRGHVHRLYLYGFLIFALSLLVLPLCRDIYSHCATRFVQGIGLAAIFVAAEYCIGRWYGPLERGQTMGLAMMIFSTGFCLGFLLPNMFEPIARVSGISALFLGSVFWCIVVLLLIPWTYRIHLPPPVGEDIEEETGEEMLSKRPLIAAAIYGITEMGLFAVFFPAYPEVVPLGGEEGIDAHVLVLVISIGVFVSSYFLGWLSDRMGAVPVLTFLALVAVASFCILPFSNKSLTHVLCFALGVVIGGLAPLGFSWLLEVTDNERYIGAASGAFSKYQGAGSMFGCIVCAMTLFFVGVLGFLFSLSLIFIVYFYLLVTSVQPERNAIGEPRRLRGLLSLLEPRGE